MQTGIAIKVRFLLMMIFTVWVSSLNAAPGYVEKQSVTEVLSNTSASAVSTAEPWTLPFITWGGDIATILANGGTETTNRNSIFGRAGLNVRLQREDVFSNQVRNYLKGETPFLRGTMGMLSMASEVLNKDPATRPVIIYQMTWSTGGDALVVKGDIANAADLKGKTIALQAFGPHVDYMTKILTDAGLSVNDVNIKWLPDLTGTDDSPLMALQDSAVDAVFVIVPDAMVLTSGGTVGTGSEDSVRGAKILLSTRTASRIIADVYAVRSDFYQDHQAEVGALVDGLIAAQEELKERMRGGMSNNADRTLLANAGKLLFDSPQAVADVKGLYADCEFVGANGNQDFFNNPSYPRSAKNLSAETQASFVELGLISKISEFQQSSADFGSSGTRNNNRFDQEQVASVIAKKQQQGTLGDGELFSFNIFFEPNQNEFSADLYEDAFKKVLDYAATYGGALITVEGHSDPLGYLRQKKGGATELVLGRIKQSAKNLSLTRTIAVRDSLIDFSKSSGIELDQSQFAVIGHGIAKPQSGTCGDDPCAPKTEKEWRDNMRVQFRIIQVEAESSVFSPL